MNPDELDARLRELFAEVRAIREALDGFMTRVEPLMGTARWVDSVIKHQAVETGPVSVSEPDESPADRPRGIDSRTPSETEPGGTPRNRREHFLCRWLGHRPGPPMGLQTVCSRCGQMRRVSRGL